MRKREKKEKKRSKHRGWVVLNGKRTGGKKKIIILNRTGNRPGHRGTDNKGDSGRAGRK